MFCMNCGKELPSDASFCLECGKPTGSNQTKPAEVKREVCEIVYDLIPSPKSVGFLDPRSTAVRFWAKAIGPDGVYTAALSPTTKGVHNYSPRPEPDSGEQGDVQAFNTLISRLVNDGWQPLPDSGPKWFSRKFERLITSENLHSIEQIRQVRKQWLEAMSFLDELRRKDANITLTSSNDILVSRIKLTSEIKAKIDQWKPLLDEKGVRSHSTKGSTEIYWETVKSITLMDRLILFFYDLACAIFLTKSAFANDAECTTFLDRARHYRAAATDAQTTQTEVSKNQPFPTA